MKTDLVTVVNETRGPHSLVPTDTLVTISIQRAGEPDYIICESDYSSLTFIRIKHWKYMSKKQPPNNTYVLFCVAYYPLIVISLIDMSALI